MKKIIFFQGLAAAIIVFSLLIVLPPAKAEEPLRLVGHISYLEGELSRYDAEEKDWLVVEKDAPLGKGDVLSSDKRGKAEFLMPNNTWARIGGDTEIKLIELNDRITEFEMDFGIIRCYNRNSDGVIRVGTPFGYVDAPSQTSFDVYLGDGSVEVVALKGIVDFFHARDDSRHDVEEGSSSLIADRRRVSAGEGLGDNDWVSWNQERESLWAQRERNKGESAQYLPSQLYNEAYALDEYGGWERVYYDGGYHQFWRPRHVRWGWSPFTVGRWSVWFGDHTWISYEPFGYITHHYGNWIFVGGFWYWAPPAYRHSVHTGSSLFDIGFAWYPGRVAWLHHTDHIGWVPLAPHESYYCHRYWGPQSIVVNNIHIINTHHEPKNYRHYDHAVVVKRHDFYDADNYDKVRIRNIDHVAINNYRVEPVMNDTVLLKHRRNDRDASPGNRVNKTHDFRREDKAVITNLTPDHKGSVSFFSETEDPFRKNSRLNRRKNQQDVEENRTKSDKTISDTQKRIFTDRDLSAEKIQSPISSSIKENQHKEIGEFTDKGIYSPKFSHSQGDNARDQKKFEGAGKNGNTPFSTSGVEKRDVRSQQQIQIEHLKQEQKKGLDEGNSRSRSFQNQDRGHQYEQKGDNEVKRQQRDLSASPPISGSLTGSDFGKARSGFGKDNQGHDLKGFQSRGVR